MIDVVATAELAADAYVALLSRLATGDASLPAVRIPGRTDSMFALSPDGDFYLMIKVADDVRIGIKRFEVIQLGAGAPFTVSDSESEASLHANFATIMLERNHLDLLGSFGLVAGVLLRTLNTEPQRADLVRFLESFAELFSLGPEVDSSKVLGLWGELWLMSQAENPAILAAAWHADPYGRFDFSLADRRIEVKTTQQVDRVHHFSLAQLEPQHKPTIVASLLALPDQTGSSIADLLVGILDRIDEEAGRRVSHICLATLGGDLEAASDYRFSANGLAPLLLVPAAAIPRVSVPTGAAITDVQFCVDLTDLAQYWEADPSMTWST